MLKNNRSKLLRTAETPAPTRTLSFNFPCEPALVRLTTGQKCTKLVVVNFVKLDI